MKNGNLMIFSLLLISIILISGCQYSAVGGEPKGRSIVSIGSLKYTSSTDSLGVYFVDQTKAFSNLDYCFNGAAGIGIGVGNIIRLTDTGSCYVVLGCSSVRVEGKINGQNYKNDGPYKMEGTTINPSNPGPVGWYAEPLILIARPIMSTGEQIQCNQGPNVPVTTQDLIDSNTHLVGVDLVAR